jgi:hypothetical protein
VARWHRYLRARPEILTSLPSLNLNVVSTSCHLNYRGITKVCDQGEELMSPVKVIAATALSIGMVAAAGIAGFAVVNSSSTSAASDTITLLASETATGQAPFYQPGDLPAVMTFEQSQSKSSQSGQASAQSSNLQLAVTQPSPSASVRDTPLPTSSVKAPEITSLQARSAVLSQVNGTVVSTTEVTRNGYEAFAVKVNLNDGSTATGYVDKKSGVVFDWNVVGAPATTGNGSTPVAPAAPQATKPKYDDKNDDHEESNHKEDSKSSHDSDDDEDEDDD